MKIEFVTDTFAPDINGVAMTLGRLVEGLRSRGHRVHVWHTAERPIDHSGGQTTLPSIPLPGYREVRMGLPGRLKLQKRWRRERPDVIYVATESLLGLSAIKAAGQMGIPVAAGFHTNFDQYLSRYRLPQLKPAMLSYLKKVHNLADGTFAPSREVVARLQQAGFRRVHLLGRGVDTQLFHPRRRDESLREKWRAAPSDPVVLMVGRLAPEKNLALGLRAYQRIRAEYPCARLVVVGDGPLRESLAAQEADVIFAGVQRGEKLARHYASCDVLLFPSETETFGNVLLEAMASGLSTVSYDYAAAAQHVQHFVNGRKVPVGQEDEFIAQALGAFGEIPGSLLRARARASVLASGWEDVFATFEARLAEMVAEMSERQVAA